LLNLIVFQMQNQMYITGLFCI